jgi:2-C-methyl-D-erythritol 4-phosphate cytidylyltransferase/2-C-methyl-D-erythritol 2,4-cyclodiphosphate synthase
MGQFGVSALVPSAGRGKRIRKEAGGGLPKQYLKVGGVPILARTLAALNAVPEIKEIIVASAPEFSAEIRRLASDYGIQKLKRVVRGGRTRTDSVYEALRRSSRRWPYALIHDGVRPFLSARAIGRFLAAVRKSRYPAWVVGRPVVPTIKEVRGNRVVRTVDRAAIWEIETPQVFAKKTLRSAYRFYRRDPFSATDDAALVERAGETVRIFPLRENNMKITTPDNLETARKYFGREEWRTGWGEDRHRLVPGRALYLGGLKIASDFGARGHSDGDVILHAVTDALLGALGLGDIGDFFPDTDPRYRGAASRKFVEGALERVQRLGYEVANVDTTLILESPKLGPSKKMIRKNLALILKLTEDRVGVKAKTAEGLGPEGRGEAIEAHAVVTLRKPL